MIVILKRLNCVKVLWEPYFSHPLMCFPSSIVRKLLKNLSSKWLRWLVVTGRKCVNIETLCYFPCTHSIWRGFQYVHHFSLQLNMWFKQKQIACTLFHDFVHFERIVKWNVTSMGICYFTQFALTRSFALSLLPESSGETVLILYRVRKNIPRVNNALNRNKRFQWK